MAKTIARDEIAAYLDQYLDVAAIADSSPNGLQVQGAAAVKRIAYAVDASLQTIKEATRADADLLIVHHGLWWGRHEQIVGNMHGRIASLITNHLSLYAAHLPLDCHATVGNNAELARILGMKVEQPFGEYRGTKIGLIATLARAQKRDAFVAAVADKLDTEPSVLDFGPASIKRVAVVSGAGASVAEEAARAGCDTLLTGETSHAAFHPAREAGINLVFAGHYATETVGLRALQRHIARRFGIAGVFVAAPTGY
ncbi:MAG TPA: Nif3-like dinuclear metal center hexameric protein [Candidatus Krumholzibacteria bacterium]|nr:Nif3-like dinuclear metal center hexameric protein [Candidatus Krumholzibacteria bacterium]